MKPQRTHRENIYIYNSMNSPVFTDREEYSFKCFYHKRKKGLCQRDDVAVLSNKSKVAVVLSSKERFN